MQWEKITSCWWTEGWHRYVKMEHHLSIRHWMTSLISFFRRHLHNNHIRYSENMHSLQMMKQKWKIWMGWIGIWPPLLIALKNWTKIQWKAPFQAGYGNYGIQGRRQGVYAQTWNEEIKAGSETEWLSIKVDQLTMQSKCLLNPICRYHVIRLQEKRWKSWREICPLGRLCACKWATAVSWYGWASCFRSDTMKFTSAFQYSGNGRFYIALVPNKLKTLICIGMVGC